MIIWISAVGSTGKTMLAQSLLEKYHIPYFSVDHLKMGLYRGDDNCGFTPVDSTEMIGDKLWPIVKGMMMTAIENNQQMIIEGIYLLPGYLEDLDDVYLQHVIPIFFGFSPDYIQAHFQEKIIRYRNIIEKRKYHEERAIVEIIEEHEQLKAKCLQSGVPYFEIDSSYEQGIREIYDYLDAEIEYRSGQ